MPIRTRSQRIGDAAEDFVRLTIGAHPAWVIRDQDRDFGIDFEAELAEPAGENQALGGQLIKIQVKGSSAFARENGEVLVDLKSGYLDYIRQFRLPVILIAAEPTSTSAWYIWLQKWILENELRLAACSQRSTVALAIPETQTLNSGLDVDIRRIARGEDHTSVVLALRDLVAATIATGNLTLFDGVSQLLGKADIPDRILAVQKITDTLIGLGPNGGFWRAQQFVPQLMRLVKAVGSTMTAEQMVRLVRRGESYSRSGLYGLSSLYDDHWDHARTLDLPATFRKQGNEDVAWYCDLRECYREHSSVRLWDGITTLPNLTFGQLTLSKDEGIATAIRLKWPNRGDSVFLDHLVWTDQPRDN